MKKLLSALIVSLLAVYALTGMCAASGTDTGTASVSEETAGCTETADTVSSESGSGRGNGYLLIAAGTAAVIGIVYIAVRAEKKKKDSSRT